MKNIFRMEPVMVSVWKFMKLRVLLPILQDILEAQMVVTVEPGLYFPGHWGIQNRRYSIS